MISENELLIRGLKIEEYELLKEKLNREPTIIELDIASAMWSEHCSYKSSKKYLKQFPTTGDYVVIGPGENAGVVDIGDGFVAAFKMESHNHPSFIEPYQGAATGVGGILRDVFTMGARPVLNMDALFFGNPKHERTNYLIDGVVRGVGDYGNCVGVPTIGGQTTFDECYNGNNLVNAFTLGIGKKDNIFLGVAKGVGNPVFYVGSKTGRDGIHGATMASASFDENFEDERPAVQVGDPFTEKLLLEACLELMQRDIIEGIQDMGAAGLTSSSFEMAQRGDVGLELYLDRVPTRQKMTPNEIMLSESQERMLIIAKKGKEDQVKSIFNKWSLDAEVIGKVTDTKSIKLFYENNLLADINVSLMVDNAPIYDRPIKKPSYINTIEEFDFEQLKEPTDYNKTLLKLISSYNLSNKHLLYEQYDSTVQTNTILKPGSDACVIRIKDTNKGVCAATDVNPRYVYINPYTGSQLAFIEAFRNLITVGAKPIAITDCLNFGNPENPEIMWQFAESTRGLADICRYMDVPVVSGNVSFYNETAKNNIYPTPTVGMVGIMDKPLNAPSIGFKKEANSIYLIGTIKPKELGGSEYLKVIYDNVCGKLPDVNMDLHKKLAAFMQDSVDHGYIASSHDISDGGIAVCLSEMCISSKLGAVVGIHFTTRADFYLFSESQGAIVIESNNDNRIEALAKTLNLEYLRIGKVGGDSLKINNIIDIGVDTLITENNRFFKELFD